MFKCGHLAAEIGHVECPQQDREIRFKDEIGSKVRREPLQPSLALFREDICQSMDFQSKGVDKAEAPRLFFLPVAIGADLMRDPALDTGFFPGFLGSGFRGVETLHQIAFGKNPAARIPAGDQQDFQGFVPGSAPADGSALSFELLHCFSGRTSA